MGNSVSYHDVYEYSWFESVQEMHENGSVHPYVSNGCGTTEGQEDLNNGTVSNTQSMTHDMIHDNTFGVITWLTNSIITLAHLGNPQVLNRLRILTENLKISNRSIEFLYPYADIKPRIIESCDVIRRTRTRSHRVSSMVHANQQRSESLSDRQGGFSASIDELRCSICLEIFDRPVATRCGHVFCIDCITMSLVCRSLCPLCRTPVFADSLQTLAKARQHHMINYIRNRFLSLKVECPKCLWEGTMCQWTDHVNKGKCCNLLQRSDGVPVTKSGDNTLSKDLLAAVTSQDAEEDTTECSQTLHHQSGSTPELLRTSSTCGSLQTQQEDRVASNVILSASQLNGFNRTQLDDARVFHASSRRSPVEALVTWLIDHTPGHVTKFYITKYIGEDHMNPAVPSCSRDVYRSEAVIEFSCRWETEQASESQVSHNRQQLCFLILETNVNCPNLVWKILRAFPGLKSTVRKVSVTSYLPPVTLDVIINFILTYHSRFSGSSGDHFTTQLERTLEDHHETNSNHTPGPKSYSPELIMFLRNMLFRHSVDTTVEPTRYLHMMPRNPAHPPTHTVPFSLEIVNFISCGHHLLDIRMSSLLVILSPLPYRNTPPFTIQTAFGQEFYRTLSTSTRAIRSEAIRHPWEGGHPNAYQEYNTSQSPSGSTYSNTRVEPWRCASENHMADIYNILRYLTIPTLLLHLQSRNDFARESWDTVGYLALDFQQCYGVKWQWFFYNVDNSTLQQNNAFDEAVMLSIPVCAPLWTLYSFLEDVQHKNFNSHSWSSWHFAQEIFNICSQTTQDLTTLVANRVLLNQSSESLADV